jgi:hypothetical protein
MEYRPNFAQHVVGSFEPRRYDEEDQTWEPQQIEIRCERCGDATRKICTSGHPREWVSHYAVLHLHRDPLQPS